MIISASDPRGPRAVELALHASSWQVRGRAYRIPSSTTAGRFYDVSQDVCTCAAYRYAADRLCRHVIACRLVDELANERAAF